jgi:hypothetical protein
MQRMASDQSWFTWLMLGKDMKPSINRMSAWFRRPHLDQRGERPEREKSLHRRFEPGYCGRPTLRTSSANRGSERRGSSWK